jgi:hypothetical protein
VDAVLVAALAGALVLRVLGLGYGLPTVYNPDEVSIFSRALSLAERGLNPGNFVYPSLYFYLLAAAVGGWYGGLRVAGQAGSIEEFQRAFWADPGAFYLVGRSVSVVAGVASVALTYALARRIGGRGMARVAAILIAVAYFPVRDAHMIKHDVVATCAFLLCVLAAYRACRIGRPSAFAAAGALGGATLALHYYGIAAAVPLAAAVALGTGWRGPARVRLLAAAAMGFALAFALLSPYVLLDWATAMRDIAANRAIVVDRARAELGWLGPGLEQLRLLVTQGAGYAMSAAALAGVVVIWRRDRRAALLFFSLPAALLVLLSQTWPYGRLQNALYPFLAVAAAAALQRAAMLTARPGLTLALLATIVAAQPLWQDALLARHLTREDTRTAARRWIERHVPEGAVVAVQPYSVQLESTRAALQDEIGRQPQGSRPGARVRGLLARDPYPSPAYRVLVVGDTDTDAQERHIPPSAIVAAGARTLRDRGVEYVVLRLDRMGESTAVRERLAAGAALVHRESPFARDVAEGSPAFLADYDVKPSLSTARPGPIVEVWRIESAPVAP